MNVSKNAWHFKAVDHFGTKGAKEKFYLGCHTTCSYIRAVIWAVLMAILFGSFMTAVAGGALTVLVSMVAAPIQLLMGIAFVKGTWTGAAFVFGTMGWIFAGVITAGWLIAKLSEYIQSKSPSAEEKASLIKQAYADKKEGICTLVKVVD